MILGTLSGLGEWNGITDDQALTYCSNYVQNPSNVPACVAAVQAGNDPSYLNASSGTDSSLLDWFTSSTPAAPPPASGAAAASVSTGAPWYQSLATGITSGIISNISSKPNAPIVLPTIAPPWYTTPTGIGAIAVGALVIWMLVKK